jgi:hypothetical protein
MICPARSPLFVLLETQRLQRCQGATLVAAHQEPADLKVRTINRARTFLKRYQTA